MKTVNARDLQKRIKECVDISQQDKVVITRRGKPAAILVGVEGKDWADVALQTSSSFLEVDRGKTKGVHLIYERITNSVKETQEIAAQRRR
jgi:prevent-host-death family protein